MKIVRFHQDRYRPNAPPWTSRRAPRATIGPRPQGHDRAALYLKKVNQAKKKGGGWGDETTGIVYQLAKQKH